jgi:catechol 2,3-dioxygenase-like lactoylglutathione lyase family enzyme
MIAESVMHNPSCKVTDRRSRVTAVGMTVHDLERSIAFYRDVLGFELGRVTDHMGPEFEKLTELPGTRARRARLWLGSEVLELTEFVAPRGRAMPADTQSNDRWFQHVAIVVSDMQVAYDRLVRHKVRHASPAPQTLPEWNPQVAGIKAFYFRDPDGHFLELLSFPSGKGAPRWQQPSHQLFLGIDHTAIVVRSTAESLAFYCDRLGLRIDGRSENRGIEQELLNNVPDAHLRITTLRGTAGPGVELLEYLSPRTGRSRQVDSRPNDHWHWQTTIAGDFDRRGLIVDPDGHVIHLMGKE